MKRILFAISVLVASAALGQTTEIDRAGAASNGMEASFTHRFTPKGFSNAQVESGTVLFGSLPAMRWTYSNPEPKVFVFNGTRSWFYVPADKQVTVADVDDQRKREVPFLLIGDPAARDRNFKVRQQPRGGSVVTTLQPRDAAALVRNVVITTDASSHLITALEYSDRQGNRTAFQFSGYHRASPASDAFNFVAPPGVQVVRAQ